MKRLNDQSKLVKECVTYFKSQPGFHRLIQKMTVKYQSLGKIGGYVILTDLDEQERKALSGLFAKPFESNVKIGLKEFECTLKKTKYHGVSSIDLLEAYHGSPIKTNKEKRVIFNEQRMLFFQDIIKESIDPYKTWLEKQVDTGSSVSTWFNRKYNEDKAYLENLLKQGNQVINQLPFRENHWEHRSIFATKILGDPHGLDDGEDLYRLLFYYIEDYFGDNNSDRISQTETLYKAGLFKDMLVNTTITYGLKAYHENGGLMEGWAGALKDAHPYYVSLWQLKDISRIVSDQKEIYVVENPAVFDELIKRYNDRSYICTMGQLNYSNYLVMDRLVEEGHTLYYSGDYDPEGLLILDKIYGRYNDSMRPWCYSVQFYKKYSSDNLLTQRRLKQLDGMTHPDLLDLKDTMKAIKKPAYQEALLEELILFLSKKCH